MASDPNLPLSIHSLLLLSPADYSVFWPIRSTTRFVEKPVYAWLALHLVVVLRSGEPGSIVCIPDRNHCPNAGLLQPWVPIALSGIAYMSTC